MLRPAGSTNPIRTGAPGNGTPGIVWVAASASTPPGVSTRCTMSWPVLVLRTRTAVSSLPVGTQPSRIAKEATTAEQLPQLLPQSTLASSIPTWAKVYSTSTPSSVDGARMTALLVVDVPPPTPSTCRWSGLP